MKTLNLFNKFLRAEDENIEQTIRQFGKDLELYKSSFNFLCDTKAYLYELMEKDPSKIPTPKKIILMVITRITQSIQSIRILNLRGYYYDVKVLERCLLESMGLCAYLALNEEEVDNWLKGNVKIARIKLVDYISLLLDTEEHHGIPFYGKLSRYVHTDVSAIASLIVDTDHEAYVTSFQLTPIFDKEKVSEISWYPTLMLAILRRIFLEELSEKRKGEIMRFLRQYVAEKKTSEVNVKE